jgi:glucose-1-phosphate cytidylyltransferase
MKTIILCGGLGTRISEETVTKPKPMVEIGDRPILWHIMKGYAHQGFDDFVLALGYRGDFIKDYFVNYAQRAAHMSVDLGMGEVKCATAEAERENWRVLLADTGANTMTGGRLARLKPVVGSETFMLTYGDGVANVDVNKLLAFHRSQGRLATLTAVRPPARFGTMSFEGDIVVDFKEKSQQSEGWINGGFFVFEPGIFDYLRDDNTILESDALEKLSQDRQLAAYKHDGFWQCMDTLRDRNSLAEAWQSQRAPWKIW